MKTFYQNNSNYTYQKYYQTQLSHLQQDPSVDHADTLQGQF